MKSPQENRQFTCLLEDRCLIKISGADAASFLQDLVSNDVMQVKEGSLTYACLLTPQGRFLHDFFISKTTDGFFLECETLRREDLIRRLKIFKLRAKVTIEDCSGLFNVYVSSESPKGIKAYPDPRLPALGYRFYLSKDEKQPSAISQDTYRDMRISLCVPEGSADIKPEIDTLADVNLDCLNAVSWTKGCYVGQEITARMNNRGLVKKRMVVVSGQGLSVGDGLSHNEYPVGDIRSVNSSREKGMAILKLAVLKDFSAPVATSGGATVSAYLPEWLSFGDV